MRIVTDGALALTFRRATFGRYWVAGLASEVGDAMAWIAMAWIALPWFVLQTSGSASAAAAVLLALELPAVATGALLGSLSDQLQPRVVMAVDNAVRALVFIAIPVLYTVAALPLALLIGLAALAGALEPATRVGGRVMLPDLVADDELDAANTLVSLAVSLAVVAGPALAGVLIATLGGPAVLLFDAASFVLMAVVASTLPRLPRSAMPQPPTLAERFGWRQLWSSRIVRATTLLSLVFFFSYGPLEAAMPAYSARVLGAGSQAFGLLWSALGVGMLVGTSLSRFLARRVPVGRALPAIAALWGVCLLPLIGIRQVPLAAAFLALGGLVWGPYTPLETTLLQRSVPRGELGRVFGARSTLLTSAAPLGIALGGAMLAFVPPTALIALSGMACVAVGAAGLNSKTLRSAGWRGSSRVTAGEEI